MSLKPKQSKEIKEAKPVDNDNILFKKLRKLINLIDHLRDVGVNEYIQLYFNLNFKLIRYYYIIKNYLWMNQK